MRSVRERVEPELFDELCIVATTSSAHGQSHAVDDPIEALECGSDCSGISSSPGTELGRNRLGTTGVRLGDRRSQAPELGQSPPTLEERVDGGVADGGDVDRSFC